MPDIEQGNYNAVSMDEGKDIKLLLVGRPVKLAEIKEINPQENHCDTWLWNAKNWNQLNLNSAPSIREGQSMVYDKKNKQVILFGGSGREEARYDNPNDVWIFKKGKWKIVE